LPCFARYVGAAHTTVRHGACRRATRPESFMLPTVTTRSQPSSSKSTCRSLRPRSTVSVGWRRGSDDTPGDLQRFANLQQLIRDQTPLALESCRKTETRRLRYAPGAARR
jgi:hypothetical protein